LPGAAPLPPCPCPRPCPWRTPARGRTRPPAVDPVDAIISCFCAFSFLPCGHLPPTWSTVDCRLSTVNDWIVCPGNEEISSEKNWIWEGRIRRRSTQGTRAREGRRGEREALERVGGESERVGESRSELEGVGESCRGVGGELERVSGAGRREASGRRAERWVSRWSWWALSRWRRRRCARWRWARS